MAIDTEQQKKLDDQIEQDRIAEAVEEVIDDVMCDYINNIDSTCCGVDESAMRAALRRAFVAWGK